MEIGWMVDELADMEKFAELNGMDELRNQLARCRELAIGAHGGQEAASSKEPPER